MKTINGWVVLYSKRDLNKWKKEKYIKDGALPPRYPCIAMYELLAFENSFPIYYTKECVQGMLDSLNTPKPL